ASAGQQLLWLPGVTALLFDDRGRVLRNRRPDTGGGSVIGGVPGPGEQPAAGAGRGGEGGAARRCAGERGGVAQALSPDTYGNGDTCQFMDITFRCRAVGGEARVNDDESLDVGWFEPDALPELNDFARFRVKQAMSDAPTWFDTTGIG